MNQRIIKIAGLFPYLIALFLNAFVDLGHKITIQNTIFKVYDGSQQIVLTALVNGLILLPFILLFTPAGFVSDKYPKNKVMRATGWGAVALTLAITICYYQGWFWPAFAMTFLLAIQSAFYSPAKQGYIKPLFGKDRLAIGNGIAQALAIIAILFSTFLFSFLFDSWYNDNLTTPEAIIQNLAPLGWVLVANSILELFMLYRLPQLETTNNEQPFVLKDHISGKLAISSILPLFKREVIFLSMVGLAVFWSVGQVMLAAFPAFAKESLGVSSVTEIQAVLAASGLGIALGSMIAGRLSRNYIETGLIPVGAAGIALGLLALPFLNSTTLHAINYLFIGTMGGLFIVPLNALIQFHAGDDEMGQILSSKNWAQNIAMLSFLILTAVSSYVGASSKGLLTFIAFVALAGGLYTVWKLPQSLLRFMIGFIATRVYKVNVQNLKNLPSRGGVLLLGNHISWIDWMIIQIASPRPIRFVMHQRYFNMWHSKWLFKAFGCIPIAAGTNSQQSLQKVAEQLNDGEVVCLFPEGTISRTGHLNEFKSGFERACELANDDVVIVPFYVRGLWGSQFSFASERLKENTATSMTRDLIVAFGKPLPKTSKTVTVKQKVFDLSMSAWKGYTQELPSLTNAWIKSVKRSRRKISLIDTQGTMLSPAKLLTASICFSRFIKNAGMEKNVGILLPTSAGAIIANMASLLAGKTLVNLNYTASVDTLLSALEQGGIKRVYTSKKFLTKLQGRGIQLEPLAEHVEFIYMEELKTEISKLRMLATLTAVKLLPAKAISFLFNRSQNAMDTAAILFSSGSESAPKGIMLSHQNIMANSKQISQVLNTRQDDVMMASLPLFHAFGLTVNQFMSLVEDIPVVCHADPTDALGTAKAIATHRATILCGTSTFLRLYCRNSKVHPLMLESLRVIVAGAEKLNAEVRQAFKLKFNKDIFEGYGATETTPVAAVNIPDSLDMQRHRLQVGTKLGSVGMPLPGTSFKIVDPETFVELETDEEGMILIGGSQVMQGYLNNAQKTDEAIIDLDDDRWYITGDKGKIDKDGFVTIVDRYSRFAKLGGEMISLGQVELVISEYLQDADNEVFAVNLPDDKKGEKIILLHTKPLDTKALKKAMSEKGCPGLMVPSQYFLVEELPKLGSGKPDFRSAKNIAEELINAS